MQNELTPNEQCVRCKITTANFICDECKHNTLYCSNCDGYVHSLPSKSHHQRRFIQDPINDNYLPMSPSLQPSNLIDTRPQSGRYNYQIPVKDDKEHIQMTISQNYINEIKEIYQKEKEGLITKINILNKQHLKSTSTLNERINYLHSYIEAMKKEHSKEIEQILNENDSQTNQLALKQKDQVTFLNEKIKKQEQVVFNQAEKIKEYENAIYENEESYKGQSAKANRSLEEVVCENNSLKQFYEQRIADLIQIAGEDKKTIVNTYEESIHQLKEGYQISKEKYLKVIQQREDDMKEMMKHYQQEINELNSIIDKLKENYDSIKKDQDELIGMNQKLKEGLEKANEIIEQNNEEINQHKREAMDLKVQLDYIQQKYATGNENREKSKGKINQINNGKVPKPQKGNVIKKKTK